MHGEAGMNFSDPLVPNRISQLWLPLDRCPSVQIHRGWSMAIFAWPTKTLRQHRGIEEFIGSNWVLFIDERSSQLESFESDTQGMQDSMPDMFTQFVGIVLEWYGSLRKSTTGSNSVVFQQTWRLTCQVREIWTMSWTSPHTRNFRKGFALLLLLSLMLSLLYVTFVTRGFNRWERCSREVWTDDSWSKCEPAMFSVVYLFDFLALPFLLLQGFQLSFPFRWCSAMHSLLTKICFWTFLTSSRPCKKGLPSRTTLWTLQWFLWWESCDWENAVKSTSWHSSIPRFAMDDARCWARALFRPFQQGRGRNVSSDHSVDTGTVKLTEVKGSEEMWKTHFWLNFWIAGCCPVRVRRADMFLRTWCPNGESRTALTLNFCFACVTCFPKFLSFSLFCKTLFRMNIPIHCLCDHIYLRERSDDAPLVVSRLLAGRKGGSCGFWIRGFSGFVCAQGCYPTWGRWVVFDFASEAAVTHRYGQKYSTTVRTLTVKVSAVGTRTSVPWICGQQKCSSFISCAHTFWIFWFEFFSLTRNINKLPWIVMNSVAV